MSESHEQASNRPGRQCRHHWIVLLLSIGIVLLSCLLVVRPDQRMEFGFLPGIPLPDTCLSRTVLHIPCPGCGLTRSFVYLAHGQWNASWNVHKLGWLLALVVVMQIPYRAFALVKRDPAPMGRIWPARLLILLAVLLIINGLARLLSELWP
jgi:hypothetical protein